MSQKVQFSQFIGSILQLDKVQYERIQADPQTQTLSPEAKLDLYSSEFKSFAADLFNAHEGIQKAEGRFAVAVHGLVQAAGCTFQDCVGILETSLNKVYSRSYIARLFKAGEVLSSRPELSGVTDTDKLVKVSRVPEAMRDAALASINLESSTRKQVDEALAPFIPKTESETVAASVSKPPNLKRALKTIENLAHDIGGVDAEIAQAIERLKSLVSARIEVTKSVETTETKAS
jgi:hypothetical protein